MKAALRRSWLARHVVLTTWGLIGLAIATIAVFRGATLEGALGLGLALGGLAVLTPFLFDPLPFPLTREQWPMRVPVIRNLARTRHWANILYVDVIVFHSPWRPSYCAEQLSASLLKFPWIPVGRDNIAGWMHGDRFVLKRLTLWANGMRPTASGRFIDAEPGTKIVLSIAAPAVGAYVFLIFLLAFAAILVALSVALAGEALRSPTNLVLIVLGGILFTFVVTALFASPVPIPFLRFASESERYIEFFDDVLGADVVTRE